MDDTIKAFVEALDYGEQIILLGKIQDVSDNDLAQQIGVTRPTVANRKTAIIAKLGQEVMEHFREAFTPRHFSALDLK